MLLAQKFICERFMPAFPMTGIVTTQSRSTKDITPAFFYSHFAALALNITVEDASNHGRVDMTVDFDGHIYLFEFKVVEQLPEGKALAQLIEKGYADKYRASGKPVHLVGVEFSSEKREIVAFDVQTLSP